MDKRIENIIETKEISGSKETGNIYVEAWKIKNVIDGKLMKIIEFEGTH